jgi:mannose-6-phosphate isomerase-like protein (cupin superfamily)
MITKLAKDHTVVLTETCGPIHEILTGDAYSPNIAMVFDIQKTRAHYHEGFDEIYFVLDGELLLRLYDPATDRITEQVLRANELCVINRGVHHVVVSATKPNRLCVITMPRFDATDEHLSDRI